MRIPLLIFIAWAHSQQLYARQNDSTIVERHSIRGTVLIESETAYKFQGVAIQKSEWMVKPELDIRFTKNLQGVIRGRVYTELADRLEPGRPDQSQMANWNKRLLIGDRSEAELREFFLNIKAGSSFFTLGKQQIVWGKADGLRIMDVVHPFNFREFIFDKFEDSRVPLWSVKMEFPIRAITAQLLWIPDLSYNLFPSPGAEYAIYTPIPPGYEIHFLPFEKPDHIIKDSNVGVKLSTFASGWDITINYLYYYNHSPVMEQTIRIENNISKLITTGRYERSHLAGFTFSNSFGSFTLRGESAVFTNKWFQFKSNPGISTPYNQYMGVVGIDYSGISNTLISAQVFQDLLLSTKPALGRERYEGYFSVLINRNFIHETLTLDLIGVQSTNRTDGFVSARVSYLVKSNLKIWAGFEGIYGERVTQLGQFNSKDRALLGTEIGL